MHATVILFKLDLLHLVPQLLLRLLLVRCDSSRSNNDRSDWGGAGEDFRERDHHQHQRQHHH